MLRGEDLVNVQLSLPAELMRHHRLQVPLLWEYLLVLVPEIFQGPFQPCEPAFRVVEAGLGLPYGMMKHDACTYLA